MSASVIQKAPILDIETFELEMKRNINELKTQDLRIPVDQLKIFEIKCNKIPKSARPAEATGDLLLTEFERILPTLGNLNDLMAAHKFSIAGVMLPRDLQEIQKIETRMQLNKNDMSLKQEYEECLSRCICLELVQIKDMVQCAPEPGQPASGNLQLEVRSTRTQSSGTLNKLSSSILFLGKINLNKMV